MSKYLLISLFLTGCGDYKPMPREKAIEAVKQCRDGGLNPVARFHPFGVSIKDIECWP